MTKDIKKTKSVCCTCLNSKCICENKVVNIRVNFKNFIEEGASNLDDLLKANNRAARTRTAGMFDREISDIKNNISEFYESVDTIKKMLEVYEAEYTDSLDAVSQIEDKISIAKRNNEKDALEELSIVREYYIAKILIIKNEMTLKHHRIKLIENMIEFLNIKLRRVYKLAGIAY